MKSLLCLSLVVGAGTLVADDTMQSTSTSSACSTCACTPCKCCTPKPKKCIDCECYVPSFYNLQCDWGFNIEGSFLYWYASETNDFYAQRAIAKRPVPALPLDAYYLAPVSNEHLGTDWEPGFRVGIGFSSDCDGWDWNLNYTWYKNKRTDTSTVDPAFSATFAGATIPGPYVFLPNPDQEILMNPWVNEAFAVQGIMGFDKIQAKWDLTFNQIDLEMGRKFWLSKCMAMRVYTAIRGAWIDSDFGTVSQRNIVDSVFGQGPFLITDTFKTSNWGVGPLFGIEPTWYFCSNFALYATFDGALMWGKMETKKIEDYNNTNTDILELSKSNHASMQTAIDVGIGLRWEETWCMDRYRTAFDLGWENHVWFDYNYRTLVYTNEVFPDVDPANPGAFSPLIGYKTFTELTNNLMMGGLVVKLRFDF